LAFVRGANVASRSGVDPRFWIAREVKAALSGIAILVASRRFARTILEAIFREDLDMVDQMENLRDLFLEVGALEKWVEDTGIAARIRNEAEARSEARVKAEVTREMVTPPAAIINTPNASQHIVHASVTQCNLLRGSANVRHPGGFRMQTMASQCEERGKAPDNLNSSSKSLLTDAGQFWYKWLKWSVWRKRTG
jgi:hypothetical protein